MISLANLNKRLYNVLKYSKTAMIKATINTFLQRADGWCESVRGLIFPLLELPAKSWEVRTLYRTFEWLNYSID